MEAEFQGYEENHQWSKIYQNVNRCSTKMRNTKEASKEANRKFNRYSDVVPFDETRVYLGRADTDYINASYVEDPAANRKYILTQGPLERTSGHFWLMIWEQRSKAILMLNNLIEGGVIKCHQYWPNGLENGDRDEIHFDATMLKVKLKSTQKFDFYILRTFILTDLVSNESREVLQFHYTHWPDFDLPKTSDSFLDFLFAVRQSQSLDLSLHGPAVIHCSAGIGRSGTFALVDSCLVLIEKNQCLDSINIIDRLLDLRKYRMGLIQTSDQLRFSFLAIIQGSKRILANVSTPTTSKPKLTIKRSIGMNESEDADEPSAIELDKLNQVDKLEDGKTNSSFELSPSPPKSKESKASAMLLHEEKRRKTMETIEKMKRKQKETEERLKSREKWSDYALKSSLFALGVAVCVAVYVYYKKPENQMLQFD